VIDENDNVLFKSHFVASFDESFSFIAKSEGVYTFYFEYLVIVKDSNLPENLNITLNYSITQTILGMSQDFFLIIVGVVVFVVLLFAVLILRRKQKRQRADNLPR